MNVANNYPADWYKHPIDSMEYERNIEDELPHFKHICRYKFFSSVFEEKQLRPRFLQDQTLFEAFGNNFDFI